ncbi:MAG: restriction endonuclease subunit S [Clostridiales bacterium]|nr:restriction endonuclease subunit S [Clostridiales bacterium]
MRQLLRNIAEISAGQGAPQGDSNYCDYGIPFVKAGNLQELTAGGSISDIQKVSDEVAKTHKLKLYPKGTVLFAKSGMSCLKGYVYVLPQDAYVVSHLACITPNEDISEFLRLYFTYHKPNQLIKDASYPSISLTDIGALEIDIKDALVREQIISALKSVEEVIALRKNELQKLDDLIKARFVELFEDGESPLKTVEELCSAIVDCPHTTPRYEGELKNPAIRTSEIKKGYITWDSMRYVSDEEYEERIARLQPEAGDIVYGREGTFGNAAILPEGYRFCLGQRVMLLRPDYTKCNSEYLLHAVISDDVYRQAVGKNNASTVAHVNVKDVKQFKIPLPSFEKQNRFADFVKQVDKSKVVIHKSLNAAQLLFDRLMQEYFE